VVIDEWLADYQRAGETGTIEAQLDIIWPTTGTPNRTEALEERRFRMIGSQSTGSALRRSLSRNRNSQESGRPKLCRLATLIVDGRRTDLPVPS
jgi:hypothetical protein